MKATYQKEIEQLPEGDVGVPKMANINATKGTFSTAFHFFSCVLIVLSCSQKVEISSIALTERQRGGRFYGFAGTQLPFCHSALMTKPPR